MTKFTQQLAAVRAVIILLSALTHDELRDLADMLTADAITDPFAPLPARHGLPPVDPERGHTAILRGGWQYRENPPRFTPPARLELQQAYEAADNLPDAARDLVADVVRLLQHALAPVAERKTSPDGRPLAEGTIQTKIIHRKVFDTKTGDVLETRAFGPYVYYRYWTSGGDNDRRGRRKKNAYIGKPALAALFDQTEPGSDERRVLEARIIAAHKSGAIDKLMAELGLPTSISDSENEKPGALAFADKENDSEPDADY